MPHGMGRASIGYYVAFVLLVVGLAVGAGLFWLLATRNATDEARFLVGAGQAQDCATGDRAPACYRFDVTNVGPVPGIARCDVTSGEGTVALFPDGQHEVTAAVAPGESRPLIVKVTPVSGDTVTTPALHCGVG
jgi:hypothetical protein